MPVGNSTAIRLRTRDAQRRPVHLKPARLEMLTSWIDRYRLVKEQQFRGLDAVAQWLGPRGLEMKIEEYDLRTGGSYRYEHSDDSGSYRFAVSSIPSARTSSSSRPSNISGSLMW